ncbi:MAG: hypothetical protein EXR75_11080 [Myxococcales bacterium]|nr:hypothetical protein [Myxococcales bacterium]
MVLGSREREGVVPAPWADAICDVATPRPHWLSVVAPGSSRGEELASAPVGFAHGRAADQGSETRAGLDAAAHDGLAADDTASIEAELRAFEAELGRLDERNHALEAQLAAMAVAVGRIRRELHDGCERDVVELAVAIAERIVGRELAAEPGLVVSWVHQALETLADHDGVVVRVSRDVFDSVPAETWRNAAGRSIVPSVDAKLAPGSCEVTSSVSRVDASASARIRAVVDALGISERGA